MSEKVYKKVETGDGELTFLKIADLTEIEGTFLGVLNGKFGPSYKLLTENGVIAVNGSTALNKAMALISEGDDIKMVNNGEKEIKTGPYAGKPFHDIEVFVA